VDQQNELELIEQDEQAARLRLAEMRERVERSEGVAPKEDHELLRQLEEEWKHLADRLHRARQGASD
jgi:uncharacterized alpha-E superfamily protein